MTAPTLPSAALFDRPLRMAVVGAGAIGCAMAARLAHGGHDVALVVRDKARAAIIANHGLTCAEAHATICARPRVVATLPDTPWDLLILAVKAQHLPEAVAALPRSVGAQTLVLPLVNGIPWWFRQDAQGGFTPIRAIDPDGRLAARFAPHHIIGSVVYTTAMATGPALVEVTHRQSLVLGAIDEAATGAVAGLAHLFQACGINADITPAIHNAVWTKVALNLATNPLSVVTSAALGPLSNDPRLIPTISAILDETERLAARLDARPLLTRSAMLARAQSAGSFRTSMLEDYLKGRPLELSSIADAVFELAQAIGLDLPVTRAVVDLARFKATAACHGAKPSLQRAEAAML